MVKLIRSGSAFRPVSDGDVVISMILPGVRASAGCKVNTFVGGTGPLLISAGLLSSRLLGLSTLICTTSAHVDQISCSRSN